ncbi:MAG: rRNA maturation RNase YbeY [Candidatus Zixiibacteriota bacterium]|nr:MAG: rRNA maturation RNase YbeY [candidate division Zixibacteria bacterium]
MKSSNIQNVHTELKVREGLLRLLVRDILAAEKADSGVDVILIDNEFMKQLNRKFTKRKGTTDVLSFGMKEGERGAMEYPSLGDVYVSLDQAKRQADEYGVDFEEEVARLVAHGILHLLGYDHADKSGADGMRRAEEIYLKRLKKANLSGPRLKS